MITLTYSLWLYHKHSAMSSAILNLDVEKSAVTPFNWATMSCIASRIVPLNVHKNGGMICSGFCEKSVSNNTYSSDSSSWIINGLVCSCSTNVDISDDERGMARGILFKPRVEATKQMTQNWTFRGPRISESANIASKNLVVISCFHSTLRLKT